MTYEPVGLDLEGLKRSVRELHSAVDRLADSLSESVALQHNLQSELDALREQVSRYITEDRLAQNKQFAQIALIDVRAQLDRLFGHHRAVRRGAMGILQAMDAGTVTHPALRQAAQRMVIDAPGYWLPPAQAAVVAWISDSHAEAKGALREAMGLDTRKTALFVVLVKARYGRHDAAARWLRAYLGALDCRSLGAEFVAVMDAAAQGALGRPARDELKAACIGWCGQLAQSRELTEAQIVSWRTFIQSQRQSLNDNFDLLPKVCPAAIWTRKLDWLEAAAAFGQTERWLRERLDTASSANGDLRGSSVEGLLRNLLTRSERSEASLLRASRRWQAVVRYDGDQAKAAANSSAGGSSGPSGSDFLTLLTGVSQFRIRSSPPAAQFAVTLSGYFIERAASELLDRSRSTLPPSIEVEIDGWRHAVLPGDDATALELEYSHHIDQAADRNIDEITARWPWESSRIPRRRESARDQWTARKVKGQESVQRAVNEVNKFFARWQQESTSAAQCIALARGEFIGQERAAGTPESSARPAVSPHPASGCSPDGSAQMRSDDREPGSTSRPARPALRPPDWDLALPDESP